MSAPAPTSTAATRRPVVPGRRQLGGAVVMVAIGSFLPWVETALGAKSGVAGGGPGVWTFYAAVIGLAAIIVPWRTVALVQGTVMALVALVLPVWQVVHALRLVGTGGWMPGAGVVLVLGGGVLALVAVRRMATSWPTTA